MSNFPYTNTKGYVHVSSDSLPKNEKITLDSQADSVSVGFVKQTYIGDVGENANTTVNDCRYIDYSNTTGNCTGHIVAGLDYLSLSHTGRTLTLAIAGEDKVDILSGITNMLVLRECQAILYARADLIVGVRSNIASINPAGLCTDFYAFYCPDHSGVANIQNVANRFSFRNDDPSAPIINMATTYLDDAVRHKTYTRATLPNAALYSGYEFDVSDGSSTNNLIAAKSNGVNWIRKDGTGAVV